MTHDPRFDLPRGHDPHIQIQEERLSDGSIVYNVAITPALFHATSEKDAHLLVEKLMEVLTHEHIVCDGVSYDYRAA